MASPKPQSTTQSTKVELSPEQKQIFGLAFPYAQQYASTPLQQYQGSGIAGFDPHEINAQNTLLNQTAPTVAGLSNQANDINSNVLGNTNFQLDVANNPYLRAAMEAMAGGMNKNLTDNQLPAIRAGATGASGMYSGASSKAGIAEGTAVTGTNQAIADTVAKNMFDQYNRGMQTLQGSVANTPMLQTASTRAPAIEAAVGGQNRAMEQAKLDETIRNFYTGQSLPFLQSQELMGLISGMPGGTTTSTATGTPAQPAPLMQGMGLLAALMMM